MTAQGIWLIYFFYTMNHVSWSYVCVMILIPDKWAEKEIHMSFFLKVNVRRSRDGQLEIFTSKLIFFYNSSNFEVFFVNFQINWINVRKLGFLIHRMWYTELVPFILKTISKKKKKKNLIYYIVTHPWKEKKHQQRYLVAI